MAPHVGAQRQPAAARHGVGRVGDQVDEHLRELVPIAEHDGIGLVEELDRLQRRTPQPIGHQRQRALDGLADRHLGGRAGTAAGEVQQAPDELGGAGRLDLDRVEPVVVRTELGTPSQDRGRPDDDHQGVVHLVGDAGGQLPDRRQLGRLHQLVLGAPELVHLAPQIRVEAGVLQADGGGLEERFQQLDLVRLVDLARELLPDREDGGQPPLEDERQQQGDALTLEIDDRALERRDGVTVEGGFLDDEGPGRQREPGREVGGDPRRHRPRRHLAPGVREDRQVVARLVDDLQRHVRGRNLGHQGRRQGVGQRAAVEEVRQLVAESHQGIAHAVPAPEHQAIQGVAHAVQHRQRQHEEQADDEPVANRLLAVAGGVGRP